MKKAISIIALSAALVCMVCCKGRPGAGEGAENDSTAVVAAVDSTVNVKADSTAKAAVAELPEEPVFDIVTTMGIIKVKLYKNTPKHRDNFVKLVKEKFYNDILFHRVINGFMIQTGDPYTKDTAMVNFYGQGGPGYTIQAEFVKEYTHKKGALAAARKGDIANPKKASSGSQFYIVQDEVGCSHLDGQYTVFGETISGLDVIDRIAAVPTDPYDRPRRDVKILLIKPDDKANAAALAAN